MVNGVVINGADEEAGNGMENMIQLLIRYFVPFDRALDHDVEEKATRNVLFCASRTESIARHSKRCHAFDNDMQFNGRFGLTGAPVVKLG